MNAKERFLGRIEKRGCWLWTGEMTKEGYGRFFARRKNHRAHRFAYEMLVGPIPEGLTLDHLCRMRRCVNPEHLTPVTAIENAKRGRKQGVKRGEHNAAKTHCPKGHPYSEANTYHRKGNKNLRECRTCKRDSQRAWKAKNRAI